MSWDVHAKRNTGGRVRYHSGARNMFLNMLDSHP